MSTDATSFAQGQAKIATIVDLALSCPAGGDPRWDQLLTELGCRRLPPEARARQLRDGPGQSRGALLLELRWALDAALEALRAGMDDPHRLSASVDDAMRNYVSATRPVVTTNSIFANALADASRSPVRMTGAAASQADCCACCGAPRTLNDGPNCPYCGDTR